VAHVLAFLGVSALVIVTPGQDTALTIRNTLLGGRRCGAATAIGVSAGQAVWALATSAGIAALLVASEPAFLAVKALGATYLVFIGVQALWAAVARRPTAHTISPAPGTRTSPRRALRQGVLSNLGNPKMAVFFTGLLPQFAPGGHDSFAVLLALGIAFCLLTLVWLTAYSLVVARVGDALRRPAVRRAFDATLGAVLVALGLRLAAEHR